MAENITSLFLSNIEKNREKIAFHYFDQIWKRMTFGDFSLRAFYLAEVLSTAQIKKSDRIAILSENRPDWCAAYLAVLFRNAVAVPMDVQLGPEEVRNILADAEVKALFCSAKTSAIAVEAIGTRQIKLINLDSADLSGSIDYSFDPAGFGPLADPEDIASIIYTSGTTGNPKGVMLTHKNFCSDAEATIKAGIVLVTDNVLSILPLHHTYPFMCNFMMPIVYGATVTFGPGLKAAEIIDAVKSGGVTIVLGVPRLFEMVRNGIMSKITEKGAIAPVLRRLIRICGAIRRTTCINVGKLLFSSIHDNFKGVRFFASGGARLEPAVMQELEALGFTVVEGYGLTETSPIIAFNPLNKRKPGSVGQAVSGAEIRIVEGEIWVRGPMLMQGYYKNPAATADAIKGGWFQTGDLGFIDDDGYVFITGRKKEVIVLSSGKNIYPEDIEKEYYRIKLIKEIGVVGVEIRGATDFIQAIVVPDMDYAKKHNIGNIYESIKWEISEITAQMPEYMRIRGFILHPEPLPRTSLGKLRRFMLNDLIAGAMSERKIAKSADTVLLADAVGARIVDCICAVLNEKLTVHGGDNLELDLGFDSLRKIEFITALEEAFNVQLPDEFIAQVQTVRDVVERIKKVADGTVHEATAGTGWAEILEKEPSEEDRQKAVIVYGPIERIVIRPLFVGLKLFCKLFFRMSVKGVENLPASGPYMIAANHMSFLDGFAVAAALSFSRYEQLYFLGISKFFGGTIKQEFARIAHVVPIDGETYLNRALQISSYVLRQGKSLCIFPEGGRSFTDELLPFKKGVGIIAVERNIAVVPVCIKGTAEAMPRGAIFIRPAKVEIIFGEPVFSHDMDMGGRPAGIDQYEFFADELRERVKKLKQA